MWADHFVSTTACLLSLQKRQKKEKSHSFMTSTIKIRKFRLPSPYPKNTTVQFCSATFPHPTHTPPRKPSATFRTTDQNFVTSPSPYGGRYK